MSPEHTEESGCFMVRVALGVDFSIGVMQERENIHSSVSYVLEFLKTAPHFIRLQVGCKPFEDLDAGAFIKEVQIGRRLPVQGEQVFHFREEIRIGYLKKVDGEMRFQAVVSQYPVDRGSAWTCSDLLGMRRQVSFCPCQRPSAAPR